MSVAQQTRITRAGGTPAAEPADFCHRYVENKMTRTEQRQLSLRLVQKAHDSGMLARLAGRRNLSAASDALVAAYDHKVLDAAIHAAVAAEQRTPDPPRPETIAFHLCRHLLKDHQAL